MADHRTVAAPQVHLPRLTRHPAVRFVFTSDHFAVNPPSTIRLCPVTNDARVASGSPRTRVREASCGTKGGFPDIHPCNLQRKCNDTSFFSVHNHIFPFDLREPASLLCSFGQPTHGVLRNARCLRELAALRFAFFDQLAQQIQALQPLVRDNYLSRYALLRCPAVAFAVTYGLSCPIKRLSAIACYSSELHMRDATSQAREAAGGHAGGAGGGG